MEDKLKDEVKPLDDVEFKWNIKEEEEGKWVVEPTVCSSVGCVQDDLLFSILSSLDRRRITERGPF